MMLRLDPPLLVDTPRGPAQAHVLIDYASDHHLIWVCFLCGTGECWSFPNPDILMQRNITMGVRVG